MNLTYFVMVEMLEATTENRANVNGHIQGFINPTDYLSSDNPDAMCLFYNENAAKGISECLEKYGESLNLYVAIVGVPEDAWIFDYDDADHDLFQDLIEIYPKVDPRYNPATGEFARKTSSSADDQITFEKKPIIFEKAAEIVKDLETESAETDKNDVAMNDVVKNETDKNAVAKNEADTDETLIRELLPNHQTLHEIVNARLDIGAENELSEVLISQSETSLAIMQTLMSDDLADVDDIDVDTINARIFPKIKSSESAKDYILASRMFSQFIDEVKDKENEIRSQYQRDLDAYLEKAIQEITLEYRAKVPDLTEENVNAYYESIAPLFTDRAELKDRTKSQLQTEILNEFVTADRSPVLKSLRKFVVLKEQIRQSAIAAIERVKTRESQKVPTVQSMPPMQEPEQPLTQPVENTNITEGAESLEQTPIEENAEDTLATETDQSADHNELPESNENTCSKETDTLPVDFSDELGDEETEDEEAEDEMTLDKKVEVSAVDLSALIDDSVAEDEEELTEDENEDKDKDVEDKKLSRKKHNKKHDRKDKKKMGVFGKIGLAVLGIITAGAITFGTFYAVKGHHGSNDSAKTEQVQSKTIGDTIFNVGDTLTIVGQDGQYLDVKLKEFKDDGSAIATDANGDRWLITNEQMKQYAEKHPDLFKKSDKKENSQSANQNDDKAKDNSQATDKKQQSAKKKDEKKSGN